MKWRLNKSEKCFKLFANAYILEKRDAHCSIISWEDYLLFVEGKGRYEKMDCE
jgi:hypothetical protein